MVLTKRNVDTKTVNTVVDLVEHKYNTVRKRIVEVREIPGEHRDITVRARPVGAYARAPKYVKSRY